MSTTIAPALDTAFKFLFGNENLQTTQAAVTQVKDILTSPNYQGGLCSFTETQDRASSNVRFYCDEDPQDKPTDRWTLVPDIEGSNNPNSKRARAQQEFEDKLNNVRMNAASAGCLEKDETGQQITEGEHHSTLPTEPDPNQNPLRSVVTICARSFPKTGNKRRTLSDLQTDDLEQSTLKMFEDNFLFVVIWHELMHFSLWFRWDVKFAGRLWGQIPEGSGAFGWENIINLTQQQKLLNADNHAYWGLMCGLHDMGWRLSIIDVNGAPSLDQAEEGVLVYDELIIPQSPVRRRSDTTWSGLRQPILKRGY